MGTSSCYILGPHGHYAYHCTLCSVTAIVSLGMTFRKIKGVGIVLNWYCSNISRAKKYREFVGDVKSFLKTYFARFSRCTEGCSYVSRSNWTNGRALQATATWSAVSPLWFFRVMGELCLRRTLKHSWDLPSMALWSAMFPLSSWIVRSAPCWRSNVTLVVRLLNAATWSGVDSQLDWMLTEAPLSNNNTVNSF